MMDIDMIIQNIDDKIKILEKLEFDDEQKSQPLYTPITAITITSSTNFRELECQKFVRNVTTAGAKSSQAEKPVQQIVKPPPKHPAAVSAKFSKSYAEFLKNLNDDMKKFKEQQKRNESCENFLGKNAKIWAEVSSSSQSVSSSYQPITRTYGKIIRNPNELVKPLLGTLAKRRMTIESGFDQRSVQKQKQIDGNSFGAGRVEKSRRGSQGWSEEDLGEEKGRVDEGNSPEMVICQEEREEEDTGLEKQEKEQKCSENPEKVQNCSENLENHHKNSENPVQEHRKILKKSLVQQETSVATKSGKIRSSSAEFCPKIQNSNVSTSDQLLAEPIDVATESSSSESEKSSENDETPESIPKVVSENTLESGDFDLMIKSSTVKATPVITREKSCTRTRTRGRLAPRVRKIAKPAKIEDALEILNKANIEPVSSPGSRRYLTVNKSSLKPLIGVQKPANLGSKPSNSVQQPMSSAQILKKCGPITLDSAEPKSSVQNKEKPGNSIPIYFTNDPAKSTSNIKVSKNLESSVQILQKSEISSESSQKAKVRPQNNQKPTEKITKITPESLKFSSELQSNRNSKNLTQNALKSSDLTQNALKSSNFTGDSLNITSNSQESFSLDQNSVNSSNLTQSLRVTRKSLNQTPKILNQTPKILNQTPKTLNQTLKSLNQSQDSFNTTHDPLNKTLDPPNTTQDSHDSTSNSPESTTTSDPQQPDPETQRLSKRKRLINPKYSESEYMLKNTSREFTNAIRGKLSAKKLTKSPKTDNTEKSESDEHSGENSCQSERDVVGTGPSEQNSSQKEQNLSLKRQNLSQSRQNSTSERSSSGHYYSDNETIFNECKICGKIFSKSKSFDRHMLLHSEDRPFACSVCKLRFTQNSDLTRHIIVHAKPFKDHHRMTRNSDQDNQDIDFDAQKSDQSSRNSDQETQNTTLTTDHSHQTSIQALEVNQAVLSTQDEQFECEQCEIEFGNREDYEAHEEGHIFEDSLEQLDEEMEIERLEEELEVEGLDEEELEDMDVW